MMRATPKFSVCLVAISVGLLFAIGSSVSSQEAEKINPKIKELQQKRLAILEPVCEVVERLYKNARIEYTDVLVAEREVLAARLEYAATQQDRIKVCDAAIQNAHAMQELAKAHQQNARGTAIPVLQAQVFELEAQIAREKAESGK